jgi:hypothetical protein
MVVSKSKEDKLARYKLTVEACTTIILADERSIELASSSTQVIVVEHFR